MSRPPGTGPLDPAAGQPEDDDAGTGQSARLRQHVSDHPGPVVSTSAKPDLSASAPTLRWRPVAGRDDR